MPASQKDSEDKAVNKSAEDEEGTAEGECPFILHTLTGTELEKKSGTQLKALALQYINSTNGLVLGLGHNDTPESTYDNPQLYPQAFPWLFPYGLGGIGNENGYSKISDSARKRALLMYHDKRFQLEPLFPLIAFNHEQIKRTNTGGYLLTQKATFPDIARRLLSVNEVVLNDMIQRMVEGEFETANGDAEKECFAIINDLDHVAQHVQGSRTNNKYKRNELWALMSYIGAPTWFITFAPTDSKHPIALYFADQNIHIYPKVYTASERYRLIANNPVSGARFFKFMVETFIKVVLGVGADHDGLFGKTAAYYGTVEQ
ncbi:hypothetical protein FA95DRAFT_1505980, partial [Auriscalpium vulgare]